MNCGHEGCWGRDPRCGFFCFIDVLQTPPLWKTMCPFWLSLKWQNHMLMQKKQQERMFLWREGRHSRCGSKWHSLLLEPKAANKRSQPFQPEPGKQKQAERQALIFGYFIVADVVLFQKFETILTRTSISHCDYEQKLHSRRYMKRNHVFLMRKHDSCEYFYKCWSAGHPLFS